MTEEPSGPPQPGRVAATSVGAVIAWGLLGLVGGWLVRPIFGYFGNPAPIVTWVQVGAAFLIAALLGLVAWHTWRSLHVRHTRIEPHVAVNRLVMAKASLLVGAVVVGGYAGYALSWVGVSAELGDQRMLRSGLAALGGVAIVIAAALLERACRVPADPEAD